MSFRLTNIRIILLAFGLISVLISGFSYFKNENDEVEWANYNHDPANTKFSPLTQINTENVQNLKPAWTFEEKQPNGSGLYFNPLMVRGRMIGLLPSNDLAALDAQTGKLIWQFTPDTSSVLNWARCVTYHKDKNPEKDLIYFIFGSTLYSLNANTGQPIDSFGNKGKVDFFDGMEYDPRKKDKIFVTSNAPGVVYEDLFIVGCKVPDELPSLAGDLRAFNRHTGKLVWTFHTIPKKGEFGADTWGPNARKKNGGANCWGGVALDEKRGIVYVPTSSPSFDFYGADRPGQNLFANCLLAINAKTGKRIWHFQTTHHDLWDRDNGSPPNLVTVNHNGKKIEAVALVTKMAYTFLFDRDTGKPLFEVKEVPVSTQSPMLNEKPWATQPIPTKPAPFARQGFKEEYFADYSPEAKQYLKDQIKEKGYLTGVYEPPGLNGYLVVPSANGGANWGGASCNPNTGVLYVNSVDLPWYHALIDNKSLKNNNNVSGENLYKMYCSSCHGVDRKGVGTNPSIAAKVKIYSAEKIENIMRKGIEPMPSFKNLPQEQINAIIAYLKETNPRKAKSNEKIEEPEEPYGFAGYSIYEDQNKNFPIKPPYGTLNAIDLNSGEILWQVPLGENEKMNKLGYKNTGDFNRGGGIATAGGLIFIGATGDKKLRAFDQKDGKVLWEYLLPGMATSIPSTYSINGKQYVAVAVCPNANTGFKGGYVTFALN
jgi:quinoprotein glucose dehydrogenase